MGERPKGVPGLVEGALDQGRRAATNLTDGFRKTGRWQKARLSLVGGWILASLLALWIACPTSGPRNSIGADVHVLKDSLLGGQQILVRNESDEVWTDVVLTLDRILEERAARAASPRAGGALPGAVRAGGRAGSPRPPAPEARCRVPRRGSADLRAPLAGGPGLLDLPLLPSVPLRPAPTLPALRAPAGAPPPSPRGLRAVAAARLASPPARAARAPCRRASADARRARASAAGAGRSPGRQLSRSSRIP